MIEPPPKNPINRSHSAGVSIGWSSEIKATLVLAWPLIAAQIATMAITTTDVIMMGWLGPQSLAGGALGAAFFFPFLMFGLGGLVAVAPMVAQAIGARDYRSVRRTIRQGIWVALAFCAVIIPIVLQAEKVFLLIGQDPALAALAQSYLLYAVWHFIPALIFIALRGLVSAHGLTQVILWITIVGIGVNALANYTLMFGNFGFPRLELRGAGISTSVVYTCMAGLLLGYVVTQKRLKRYAILIRFWKPDWPRFFAIIRLGLPIGFMLTAETSLFAFAAMMMGWLGSDALAAHAVAIQLASLAFMIPLGLSQATTIRVGLAYGRKDWSGVARAGWTSIIGSMLFMSVTACIFWFLPRPLVHLFLEPQEAENMMPIALAISYLSIAALFQLVDGIQVTAAAALRGMSDTKMPMVFAMVGYWLVGIPSAYLLGFKTDLQGVGIWLGLAIGLSIAAIILTGRFAMRERLGIVGMQQKSKALDKQLPL